jgi:hypothetical protein
MFRQGDREKALRMPVSPLMDRSSPGIMQSQDKFLRLVALPLFTSLVDRYPSCEPLVEGLQKNISAWAAMNKPPTSISKILHPRREGLHQYT